VSLSFLIIFCANLVAVMQCIRTTWTVSIDPRVSLKSEVGAVLSTFMDFLSHYIKMLVQYLKLGLNRFLSYHLQLTSHPNIRGYSV
jgi:hypothetical protein